MEFLKQKKPTAQILAGIILLIILVASFALVQINRNYAKEVANPIEQGLLEQGAIKLCQDTITGRGLDSKTPYYYSIFKISSSSDKILPLLQEVAQKNGFSIKEANSEIRSTSIKYFDRSVKSNFWELREGTIDFSFDIYPKVKLSKGMFCGIETDGVSNDTLIFLNVILPDFK